MRKRSSAITGTMTYKRCLCKLITENSVGTPSSHFCWGEGLNFLPNFQKDGGEACYDLNFLSGVTGKVEVTLLKTFFT